jgi:tetratricopeptide (TPR) repeat protein
MKKSSGIAGCCLLVFASVFVGCTGSKETVSTSATPQKKNMIRDRMAELNHERALQHFIDGVTLDAKERYAEAILEYQEVLQNEPNAATYYAISRDYALLGKMMRASEAARDAVNLDSMKIAYRENLASIYLSLFQQDLAIQQYEAIVGIDSTSTSDWFNLARLYEQKHPLKALAIYEKLLDSSPDEWDVLLQTAELCGNLGRFDKAATYFKRMLEIDPSNRPLQRQLAETYSKAGKMDEAVKLLETMHEEDQSDVQVSAILGEVYLDQGQYQKALPLYQSLLKLVKSNPEIKLRVGVAYVGQISRDSTFADKAKEIFEQLETELPNDFRVYWYLGVIATSQKQDSLAGTYFERVTSLDERNAEAWWFLGSNYFDRGEFRKLLKSMDRARALFPNDSRFFMLTGLAYSRLGQPTPAIQMLEQSYKLNPKDINTLGQLALTYDGMKRWKESDSLYEQALKVDSTSAAAAIILNNYGYSLAGRGLQLQRALNMATKAVAMEPNNASYLDTLGWIYFVMGDYTEAQQNIAKAVATGEASAEVTEHLGDVYFKLGHKDKALEFWQHALNMDKTNQALKEKIERGSL